jgi:hypothetical protein
MFGLKFRQAHRSWPLVLLVGVSLCCRNILFRSMIFIPVIAMLSLQVAAQEQALPAPTNLRTEYLVDPVGIDVAKPRLYWVLAGLYKLSAPDRAAADVSLPT